MKIGSLALLDLDKAITLPTPRLLKYYQKYNYTWDNQFMCDCCYEFFWDLYSDSKPLKQEYEKGKEYFAALKVELDKREHVPKKGPSKPKPKRRMSKQAKLRVQRRLDPFGLKREVADDTW